MSQLSGPPVKGRVCFQKVVHAELTKPDGTVVAIKEGAVAFVCFMKDADEHTANKMAKAIAQIRLFDSPDSDRKKMSVGEGGLDVLIIPQATLGGKINGKIVQYHANIARDAGLEHYDALVNQVKTLLPSSKVEHGVYGALQVLNQTNTCGPFTHVWDF